MSQAIKYENTSVDPSQSAAEIARLVQKYGGTRFEMRWDEHSRLGGVRFAIRHERLGEIPVRLVAQIGNVERYILDAKPWTTRMRKGRQQYKAECRDKAYRVAWRQLKDFVEQALLAVETGLFPLHEAFIGPDGDARPRDGRADHDGPATRTTRDPDGKRGQAAARAAYPGS